MPAQISIRPATPADNILLAELGVRTFFDTFAPYQHFVMNIFRAVENRKNIIISANSGLSGIIDSSGNTVLKTQINQSINVSGSVYQNDYITIYTKFGDFFAVMCISVTLFILVIIFII
jgi:apolipoprotein N-acyltransferase